MVSVNGACVKRHVNQKLDAKTKPGEQTVINTDGYVDYPVDPGNDLRDNETVTDVCETSEETLEEHQSSGRKDDTLGESSSSGCMERPMRNVRLSVWTYNTSQKRQCQSSIGPLFVNKHHCILKEVKELHCIFFLKMLSLKLQGRSCGV